MTCKPLRNIYDLGRLTNFLEHLGKNPSRDGFAVDKNSVTVNYQQFEWRRAVQPKFDSYLTSELNYFLKLW